MPKEGANSEIRYLGKGLSQRSGCGQEQTSDMIMLIMRVTGDNNVREGAL